MTPIDRTELDRLRELAGAATPGPWFWPHNNCLAGGANGDPDGAWTLVAPIAMENEVSDADAEFIAYANPERVTRLVGLVEELTAALEWAHRLLEDEWTGTNGWIGEGAEWEEVARVLLDRLGAT